MPTWLGMRLLMLLTFSPSSLRTRYAKLAMIIALFLLESLMTLSFTIEPHFILQDLLLPRRLMLRSELLLKEIETLRIMIDSSKVRPSPLSIYIFPFVVNGPGSPSIYIRLFDFSWLEFLLYLFSLFFCGWFAQWPSCPFLQIFFQELSLRNSLKSSS